MATPSKLRAHVRWKESTVFAGEEIECIITFRNAVDSPEPKEDVPGRPKPAPPRHRTVTQSTQPHSNAPSVAGSRAPSQSHPIPNVHGHRPALSLSVTASPQKSHGRQPSQMSTAATAAATTTTTTTTTATRAGPAKHGRSLSIMSMGSDKAAAAPVAQRRPAPRGHARSASMQVLSRPPPCQNPAAVAFHSYRQPSPLYDTLPPLTRRTSGIRTAPGTPALHLPSPAPDSVAPSRRPSAASPRFPSASCASSTRQPSASFSFPSDSPAPLQRPSRSPRSPIPEFTFPPASPGPAQRPQNTPDASAAPANPVARILSESSANATPRSSSSDLYSLTNQSSETIASDIAPAPTGRLLPKPQNSRNPPQPPSPPDEAPEMLMMGYAQTMGSFVLDGSLVNQGPFDQVKRKGVVGGQGGGGVVGVERSKRESGILGSFGWGNIGESLGGLLGGGEMSSIKEMRGLASSKTIPLLSTPQSILFVDLRLGPGESKSYSYKFRLPRGLPPTHKGRAIKVQYHLTIGVQRPGKLRHQQQVRHIEIPFRVLGSVNGQGETLGHDLMSPYILLDDRARSSSISISDPTLRFPVAASRSRPDRTAAALDDFLSYADQLLAHPSASSDALLSPTEKPPRRRSSVEDVPPSTMKEAIDLAILRSNLSSANPDHPAQSNNRFTIARGGQLVAVVTIVRPAYRLGETISGVIDFSPDGAAEHIPSYNITVWLETTERVDPSLAMRSASSVQRATRKTYGHVSETVMFATKTSFRLEIPETATPTFETTGVQLAWRLRIEFTTAKAVYKHRGLGIEAAAAADESGYEEPTLQQTGDGAMLEEVGRDERGTVLIAKERLTAETFEVGVPVRVYGVSGGGGDAPGEENDGLEI